MRLSILVAVFYGMLCISGLTVAASSDDRRQSVDRLHPDNNPNHEDQSYLNGVGLVMPFDRKRNESYGDRGTGFLIDSCHVLTGLHVAYHGEKIVDPAPGADIVFAVGQAEAGNKGAFQGLKYLLHGKVAAHGDAAYLAGHLKNPQNDWAVIKLSDATAADLPPLVLEAVAPADLTTDLHMSVAGFPSDHMNLPDQGFVYKDLWAATGDLVGARVAADGAALLETTIQTTPANSGGPLYGRLDDQRLVVIGIAVGVTGDGLHDLTHQPNTAALFTKTTLAKIEAAVAATPCH